MTIQGRRATLVILDDVADIPNKPYKSKKPRPFHHFLPRADRNKIEILAQRASEAAFERKGAAYSNLFGRMSKMYGRDATKKAIENADNIRKMVGLDSDDNSVNEIGNWRIGKTLSREARRGAVSYIFINQPAQRDSKTKRWRWEELVALNDHELWLEWLRT